MKKVLLINWNKIPVKGVEGVEGSGLRWWRIAKGLQKNKNLKITLATWHENYTPSQNDGNTSFTSWGDSITADKKLIQSHDTIILPMSMSGYTNKIIANTTKNQQIILDAYAPFYVEASTRSISKKYDDQNDSWYEGMVWSGNESLVNADYILHASVSQRMFYEGLLSGLGALGPKYAERERFIHFPGAVEDNLLPHRSIEPQDKLKILWFGALYPWYDITPLFEAISHPILRNKIELSIVGGTNPMYPADNLRFNGNYIKAVETAIRLKIKDKTVKFYDWVAYSERLDYFANTDVAISLNAHTIENKYSWRIRVNDLAGNGVPVITNGGDPLGEILIKEGAAIRLDISSKQTIIDTLHTLVSDRHILSKVRTALARIHNTLVVDEYADELAKIIDDGKKPRLSQHGKVRSFVMHVHKEQQERIGELEDKINEQDTEIGELNDRTVQLQRAINELPKTIKQQIKKSIIYRIKHARKK